MNGYLNEISAGAISGTGTLPCVSEIFGGAIISTDGVNAAVVTVRENTVDGRIVFQISTKTPLAIFAPFKADATLYYSITGTGASAELFEWVNP